MKFAGSSITKLIKFGRAQHFSHFSPATAPATVLTVLLDNLSPYRLPHTRRVFVTELQIFLSGWNRVKICRAISLSHTSRFFLSQLTALTLGAELSKIQDGAYSTDVTLMTFPNWLRRARAAQYVLRSSTIRYRPTSPDLVADWIHRTHAGKWRCFVGR